MSTPAAGVAAQKRPPWLAHLVEQLEQVPDAWFSRFLPPQGGGQRSSAVLILLGRGDTGRTEVVLTQRAGGLRTHAGQVSFPGGGREPADADLVGTALREAGEEIGLDAAGVDVVATLPALHIPVSGYDVTPVLGWWSRPGPIWVREPHEVARVLRVPVDDLVTPANRHQVRHPSGYVGPAFTTHDVLVWGFTAGLLDKVVELAGLTEPWDHSDVRDLPA